MQTPGINKSKNAVLDDLTCSFLGYASWAFLFNYQTTSPCGNRPSPLSPYPPTRSPLWLRLTPSLPCNLDFKRIHVLQLMLLLIFPPFFFCEQLQAHIKRLRTRTGFSLAEWPRSLEAGKRSSSSLALFAEFDPVHLAVRIFTVARRIRKLCFGSDSTEWNSIN